mgnify:CR=1 FL=1
MAVRFDVITLFPELFAPFQTVGVTRRAFETKAVDVRLWQLRDFAEGVYRRVDDRPFGGGPGMVMLVEPLVRCLSAIRADQQAGAAPRLPVVLFSPAGKPLTQQRVQQLAEGPGAVLVCGRYEGIDQRFIDSFVTHQISLGAETLALRVAHTILATHRIFLQSKWKIFLAFLLFINYWFNFDF